MKHVGSIELHNLSLTPDTFGRPAKRKSIFRHLLVALHVSRRRQARSVLRRYRDLLAEDPWAQPANTNLDFNKKYESSQYANSDQTADRTSPRANGS